MVFGLLNKTDDLYHKVFCEIFVWIVFSIFSYEPCFPVGTGRGGHFQNSVLEKDWCLLTEELDLFFQCTFLGVACESVS